MNDIEDAKRRLRLQSRWFVVMTVTLFLSVVVLTAVAATGGFSLLHPAMLAAISALAIVDQHAEVTASRLEVQSLQESAATPWWLY